MEIVPDAAPPAAQSVLVVDDHPNTADMLARAIRTIDLDAPLDVLTAITGEEALARSADRNFEVLIVDYMMPGMNGLELIDAMRRANRLPEHIILISAYTVLDSELDDREIKIDARFDKPVTTEKILTLVRGLLSEPKTATETRQPDGVLGDARANGGPAQTNGAPPTEENGP
jgi:CheY-like chemotaxis protein